MEDFSFPPRPLLVSVKSFLCTAGTNAGRLGQHQWPCPGGGSRDKMKRGLSLHESRSSSGTHNLKGTQTLRRFMALGLAVVLLPLGQTELFAQQYGPYKGQYPAYPQPDYGQPAYPQPQPYGQPAYPQSQYPAYPQQYPQQAYPQQYPQQAYPQQAYPQQYSQPPYPSNGQPYNQQG